MKKKNLLFILNICIFIGTFNLNRSLATDKNFEDPILTNSYNAENLKQSRNERNNNAYQLEFQYVNIPILPIIFKDDSLNNFTLKNQGIGLTLAKSFSLSPSFFSSSNLVFMMAQDSSGEFDFGIKRNSELVSFQFIQRIGFNYLSIIIDNATFHPFIGLGGYRSELTDNYNLESVVDQPISTEKEQFNKIAENGGLIETGFTLTDQRTGVYSTLKVGMLFPMDNSTESSMDENQMLSVNEESSISNSNVVLYSIGFGVKF